MNGPSTKMPQSPTTTLGTAASIEISEPTGPRIAGGASSLRKRPIAIESGAAMSSAPNDVTSVPMMNDLAPKTFVTGFQTSFQTNAIPNSFIAGQAPWISFQAITDDHENRQERGERGHAVERPVADPVEALPGPAQRILGGGSGFHGRELSRAAPPARGPVTTPSHDVHIMCTPAGKAATRDSSR